MTISTANFVKSSVKFNQLPDSKLPEYAFIGRSNVGKSSLLNMLTQRKKLAKTSGSPGKTTTINHFLINDNWYLVDLPGYGYAKVSKTDRVEFKKFTETYLLKRENLAVVFILIDIRIPAQKNDLDFLYWIAKNQIPMSVIFTKADKINEKKQANLLSAYGGELYNYFTELPPVILTSAVTGLGREELLSLIEQTNQQWQVG